MAGIRQFEDIVAWQAARVLVADIYAMSRGQSVARDFGFCGQIQRAAVSTMSNIAEGFERRSPKDHARFLLVARASNAELQSLLYVALDVGYIERVEFDRLMEASKRVSKLVSAFRESVEAYASRIREDEPDYDPMTPVVEEPMP